jgi:two-component system, OmpR family, phosphate regulon sensor histidine kinase PhoR
LALLTAWWLCRSAISSSRGWAGLLFYIGLSLQLAYHYRNFSRLERWSRQPMLDASLEGDGEWDGVFARLYSHEKELLAKIEQRERDIARLIAAVHVMNDGVVLLDGFFQIQFCNKTAERQLGLASRPTAASRSVNIVRQPDFVDYLRKRDFTRPLTLRLGRYFERLCCRSM